jgi:uncharacterized protein (TIGR00288 family)
MKKDKSQKDSVSKKVAILVDGDNASSGKLGDVSELASAYGEVIVKRIYGDWSKSALSGWKEPAKEYSFRLIEALPYIKGKNTTDIALVIDTMDLLNSKNIDVFFIAASDSDYTLLAQRIREEGATIIGYGESKTPAAFINSCKKFIFSDREPEKNPKAEKGDTPAVLLQKEAELFDKAYDAAADGKEEVTLSQIGMAMKKIKPKFKTGRYGCKTLGAIYEKLDGYELIQTGQKGIYNVVRRKQE